MRRSVDLPAPLAPSRATDSPAAASKETPERAEIEGFSNGWRKARQPLRAGGKAFSRERTRMAGSGTAKL